MGVQVDRRQRLTPMRHYLRGLGLSTRNNAVAYGYSVVVAVSFAALTHWRGEPSIGELFLFVLGAGAAFALVNAVTTRGYRSEPADEPAVVLALGTSFSAISIAASLGFACLVAWQVPSWPSWVAASFVATVAYLLCVGVEMALAGSGHSHGGPD